MFGEVGKTTFAQMIQAVVGLENSKMTKDIKHVAGSFVMDTYFGKDCLFVTEYQHPRGGKEARSEDARLWGKIKEITGEATSLMDKKNKDAIDIYIPNFQFMVVGNDAPDFMARNPHEQTAYERRMVVMAMNNDFGKGDTGFIDKFKNSPEEQAAFLGYCLLEYADLLFEAKDGAPEEYDQSDTEVMALRDKMFYNEPSAMADRLFEICLLYTSPSPRD